MGWTVNRLRQPDVGAGHVHQTAQEGPNAKVPPFRRVVRELPIRPS